MITEREQKMIEQVLNEFDFKVAHAYMHATGWKYYDSENPPTIYELIKLAEGLLKEVCESKTTITIGTGGFRAEASKNDKGETESLELLFVIESSYVEAEEVE